MGSLRELWTEIEESGLPAGEYIARAESLRCETDILNVKARMRSMLRVFRESAQEGVQDRSVSASGLTGGEAWAMSRYQPRFLGQTAWLAATRGMAIAEANAKMRRIVACPTAGSCGILPAVLLTVGEICQSTEEQLVDALFIAAGVGDIIAENACIAGAVGGCQAECGTAIAMAAAAGVALCGGTTEQMDHAVALGLKNVLGLVCDPVGGLVEVPCVKRNSFHAVHALVAIELALAGVKSVIPADEVIAAMDEIGKLMPKSLRERSEAGLAVTPTAKARTGAN